MTSTNTTLCTSPQLQENWTVSWLHPQEAYENLSRCEHLSRSATRPAVACNDVINAPPVCCTWLRLATIPKQTPPLTAGDSAPSSSESHTRAADHQPASPKIRSSPIQGGVATLQTEQDLIQWGSRQCVLIMRHRQRPQKGNLDISVIGCRGIVLNLNPFAALIRHTAFGSPGGRVVSRAECVLCSAPATAQTSAARG